VIFDLEDGVATGDLAAARERVGEIAAAPGGAPWLPATVAVRTHGVTHPAFADDLATLGPSVTTLMLPKVGAAQEVERARGRRVARSTTRWRQAGWRCSTRLEPGSSRPQLVPGWFGASTRLPCRSAMAIVSRPKPGVHVRWASAASSPSIRGT